VHIRFPHNLGDVCAAEAHTIVENSLLPKNFTPKIRLDETAVVITSLGIRQLFELPLRLRTAHEILWLLRKGRAGSIGDLKEEVLKVDWLLFFKPGTKVAVKLDSTVSRVFHESAATKAVQGVFKTLGFAPAIRDEAEQLVEIKIFKNQVQIALSLAAGALYKRGYKKSLKAVASLREDLAASATQLAQHWLLESCGKNLILPDLIFVPFAGSGTLGFEACLSWFNFSPAGWMSVFPCEQLLCAPKDSVSRLRKKLGPEASDETKIILIEKSASQADAMEVDLKAFLSAFPKNKRPDAECLHGDVFSEDLPVANHAFLPLNPPYGIRLKEGGPAVYQKLGSWLSRQSQETNGNISGYIFIPDEPSRKALQKNLRGFKLSGQEIINGGKTMTLALFSFWRESAKTI
jgi:23S rRNA G2445 N2-methylase RlmL